MRLSSKFAQWMETFRGKLLLPPANEVWGKVMFLHLCICSRAEGGLPTEGEWVCLRGGLPTERLGVGQTPPLNQKSGRYASYWNSFFLPPANEVWGKVICLQVCVCPQGGLVPGVPAPGGAWSRGVPALGGLVRGEGVWSGGRVSGQGVPDLGGIWSRGVPGGDPP